MRWLSAYVAAALRRPLPPTVNEKTKHHILDTIAAMISGSRLTPGIKAISYVKTLGGVKEASVIGSGVVTTAVNAALANGMLAHADETDDSHAPSLTHPGCGIVPAALAMAEREKRNGAALLRAVALGYDVGCRLTQSLNAHQFREDGHSTHSFGPMFGAAAAAGALAGLRERQVRYLLSFTAQQASGVSCWMRDGDHIEKSFDFGGMPARNGVAAATMVAHGFTGVDDVFAGERNFFVAYGRKPEPALLVSGLGVEFEIMNTNIKRWSVGSPIQAPLDSLHELIREHRITAADIDRVVVRVSHQGANTVDNRDMPDICMQHMCAVMLVDGKVTFQSSHDQKRMRDRAVLALRRRIELRGDDGADGSVAEPRRHRRDYAARWPQVQPSHQSRPRRREQSDDTRRSGREKLRFNRASDRQVKSAQTVRRDLAAGEIVRCAQSAAAAARSMTASIELRQRQSCYVKSRSVQN